MAGIVQIPWYATFFRGDKFEAALAELAPLALRYGATSYEVRRSREDRYKFLQTAEFERKVDFEAYWQSQAFVDFRTRYSGWYQIPVLYEWGDIVVRGGHNGNGNGAGEPEGIEPAGEHHSTMPA